MPLHNCVLTFQWKTPHIKCTAVVRKRNTNAFIDFNNKPMIKYFSFLIMNWGFFHSLSLSLPVCVPSVVYKAFYNWNDGIRLLRMWTNFVASHINSWRRRRRSKRKRNCVSINPNTTTNREWKEETKTTTELTSHRKIECIIRQNEIVHFMQNPIWYSECAQVI